MIELEGIEVTIVKPDITPEENARRIEDIISFLESIKYEDLDLEKIRNTKS